MPGWRVFALDAAPRSGGSGLQAASERHSFERWVVRSPFAALIVRPALQAVPHRALNLVNFVIFVADRLRVVVARKSGATMRRTLIATALLIAMVIIGDSVLETAQLPVV